MALLPAADRAGSPSSSTSCSFITSTAPPGRPASSPYQPAEPDASRHRHGRGRDEPVQRQAQRGSTRARRSPRAAPETSRSRSRRRTRRRPPLICSRRTSRAGRSSGSPATTTSTSRSRRTVRLGSRRWCSLPRPALRRSALPPSPQPRRKRRRAPPAAWHSSDSAGQRRSVVDDGGLVRAHERRRAAARDLQRRRDLCRGECRRRPHRRHCGLLFGRVSTAALSATSGTFTSAAQREQRRRAERVGPRCRPSVCAS